MSPIKTGFFVLACAFSLQAAAQWQWLDKDGRKVFSDRPPAQEVPEKNILRRPFQSPASPAAATPAPAVAQEATGEAARHAEPGAAASGKGVDPELQARIAKEEAEKAAKEKAYAQKLAVDRAENCSRAQRAKATLESSQLMRTTNNKGEQGFMDDSKRNAERKRAEAIITSDCQR